MGYYRTSTFKYDGRKLMTSKEIRQSYLDFFKFQGHEIVPSSPVVPQDDPTLLFINAGMNQFKDVFLGTGTRPYTRAADSQKCIRVQGKHNDLEEVGHDTYHHTFFEMMGNWSFGDYYKTEAIEWAWELVTKIWQLPKDNLYATVFREDDEAEAIWKKVTDIAPSHVMRFDEKDNFWEMGPTGPCGPCSEIHIDLGEGFCDKQHIPGHICNVNAGCARFIELWNLVFIQYNRDENGTLNPLPNKHVDTGLGLERTVAVLQNKKSNYQTDLFIPIFEHIAELSGKEWEDPKLLPSFRVVADHVRSLSFSITDGAIPSNEGRGYVLRRLLRRAARYGRTLNMKEPFIYQLVSTIIDKMGDVYPELKERAQHVTLVIKSEEERFNEVLDRGIEMFEGLVTDIQTEKKTQIPGAEVFKLYDTYGFPMDLTRLMAREKNLEIDESGFEAEMQKQRERARDASQFGSQGDLEWEIISEGEDSKFIGYETLESEALIRKISRQNGKIALLLNQTPFYGESGGQVGDVGIIEGRGFKLKINDTQKMGDQYIHWGEFKEGSQIEDPKITAKVDIETRRATERNHTTTHLLHKALKKVLGNHVNQAGSLVAPDHLRFDFNHFEAMTQDQIQAVEKEVNYNIRQNRLVNTFHTSLEEAKEKGVTALFGEKYGATVRVVQVKDYSQELCGGTHLRATGETGYFRIVSEEGIAAGVRRIIAITGEAAENKSRNQNETLKTVESLLKCREDEVLKRVDALLDERKKLNQEIKKLQTSSSVVDIETLLNNTKEVDGIKIIAEKINVSNTDVLRTIGDQIRDRLKSGICVFGTQIEDKVQFLCVVTDDLIKDRGLKAGQIVNEVAMIANGRGGGKPHQAMAGAKDASKLQEALDQTAQIVQKIIQG